MIVKRMVNSKGFRIYFWPILVLYLFYTFLLWLFIPFEPGSQKEVAFVIIGSLASLVCLWTLLIRYRKVKGTFPGKRALILLIVLTVVMLFFVALELLLVTITFPI